MRLNSCGVNAGVPAYLQRFVKTPFLRIRQNNVLSNHPEVLFKPLAACVPESMKTLSSVLRFPNICISLFSTLTCLKDNAAPSSNLSP